MKSENKMTYVLIFLFLFVGFFAGYNYSPQNTEIKEKNQRIKELEEVIIQQQIINQYMIKTMPQFKIENWAMNKKDQNKIH